MSSKSCRLSCRKNSRTRFIVDCLSIEHCMLLGCGNIDYLEGGPDKLKENVRDNLFAPWCLANICEKNGIHFTYLGTGCLYKFDPNGAPHKENETPDFVGNNYSVVKGFTDRLLPEFTHTLNVRIRLPFNDADSPRNLLKKVGLWTIK